MSKCKDCVFYDDGFDWEKLEFVRKPECEKGRDLKPCDKFYHVEWLKDLENSSNE